jgi:GNAT-family acetyltransferase (TIGR03103 family)
MIRQPRREQVGPGGDPLYPAGPQDSSQAGTRHSRGRYPDAGGVDPAPDAGQSPGMTVAQWARTEFGGVVLDCGWGRLVFGQTFPDPELVADVLRSEAAGSRDLCMYLPEPHVLVSRRQGELFIDPSHTYRLRLPAAVETEPTSAITIRPLRDEGDAETVNGMYARNHMVTAPVDVLVRNNRTPMFVHLVAEDVAGRVIGTVTGIDHVAVFGDPDGGTSLWCLTVDGNLAPPGTGVALIAELVRRFTRRGRSYLDLSVLAENAGAIRLYERLGFERIPQLCVKRKNPINEKLFLGEAPDGYDRLNPYARIIGDEARRRGIYVEVLDPDWGELRLTHGGRTIVTRESLSELTTAVAMSRCDDKRVTRRILAESGLRVPLGRVADGSTADVEFMRSVGQVVVKPARGEQGAGITVGVSNPDDLVAAVAEARAHCPDVLIEELCEGEDLRVVVINHEVVAAAVRRPATVIGDGVTDLRGLIDRQSRRRAAATGGESRIPLDSTTESVVAAAGHTLEDVLPEGAELAVRRTANLHTGGTIHDVTAELHPVLAQACVIASQALDIPVTGLDLLVRSPTGPDHVFVEANERPGLANHEPQPIAERFVDLLFPGTTGLPRRWNPAPLGKP